MLNQKEILFTLSELKPQLQAQYGIKNIGLFGSYVRDENDQNSDIDILLELGKSIGWEFFDIQMILEDKFKKRIDLVTKKSLHPMLREAILKEVIFA